MNKKAIAIVDSAKPRGWAYYVLRTLFRLGYKVRLLVPYTTPLETTLVYGLGSGSHPFQLMSGKLKAIMARSIIKELSPDMVINLKYLGLYEPVEANKSKVVYYVHQAFIGLKHPIAYYNAFGWKLSKPYFLLFDHILLRRAKRSFILANSMYTLSCYTKVGAKGSVVYYPCEIDGLGPALSKKNLVVSVGTISPYKQHEDILKIARLLSDTRFVIIGKLNDRRYYHKLVKSRPKNCSIMVNAPRAIVRDVLAHAKVYIHARQGESFGVAAIEGMASGCVPVVRDSGALRETVIEDVGFRWRSNEEAAEYIKEVLSNEGMRKEKARKSIERAKLFTPEKFENRVADALLDVITD